MEDFDQKQNDELQKLLQRKFNYLMIIYRSLTQKKLQLKPVYSECRELMG